MDCEINRTPEQSGRMQRPGFRDEVVSLLSVCIIVCGVFSVNIGIVALFVALLQTCRYNNDYDNSYHNDYQDSYHYNDGGMPIPKQQYGKPCEYYHTYMSAGIWAGIVFIISGMIGILSAKRKTTCFIVSMMALAIVTAWISVLSILVSLWAQFDVAWHQVSPMPIAMRIFNGVVTLFGLFAFILSWVKFGFACRAVCCNGLAEYPKIKEIQYQYQTLPSQTMMYAQSQPAVSDHCPVIQPDPASIYHPVPEPIYLVQGQRVIGVLPQNHQQPVMANTAAATATTSGAKSASTVVA